MVGVCLIDGGGTRKECKVLSLTIDTLMMRETWCIVIILNLASRSTHSTMANYLLVSSMMGIIESCDHKDR